MKRGTLRIYLGAAPGVGKTFAMLDEGRRRTERGTDVVIGYVETHGRPHTAAKVGSIEVVPRHAIRYRGTTQEEMDLDAVLVRAPKVALVDELAHTNVVGSKNAKRWEDVEELLDAGIDVISTVNVQHLESLNDVVERITGVRQQETVPDWVVRQADQVELVDMTPEAIRRRMAHGNIYQVDRVDAALSNYFRPGNLAALRELALLWVADKVDDSLQQYMDDHGIEGTWETRERVVVALTGAPGSDNLIRRAARMAQRSHGDLIGVRARSDDGLAEAIDERLEANRVLLTDLGGEYHEVVGRDVAESLARFAASVKATQLVLGASRRSRWSEIVRGSVINKAIRLSGGIDVHVISYETDDDTTHALPRLPDRGRSMIPPRRVAAGWSVAIVGLPVLTLILLALRSETQVSTVFLLYLTLICLVSGIGGIWPGVTSALAAAALTNWFFIEPYHTLTIDDPEQILALLIFVALGAATSLLVSQAMRRRGEARRARAEAEALAAVAGRLAGPADSLQAMLGHIRITFGQQSASLLSRVGTDGWQVKSTDAALDVETAVDPNDGDRVDVTDDLVLVVSPGRLSGDDRRVLVAFAARLADELERQDLERAAAMAEARSQGDQLRTAILRAVSHDLRTPLASIKASATSLLQEDIAWNDQQRLEFAHTIDEETDRLDRVIANLLDMSRIEASALAVTIGPVGLHEVIATALANTSGSRSRVTVDGSDDIALADEGLLERVVSNVLSNALRHTSVDHDVRIETSTVAERAVVRVVDQGPGIPEAHRERMFEPFQRLNDHGPSGVGLGLAVSRGFMEAMGGTLTLDDTPGGGLTVELALPVAPDPGSGPLMPSEPHTTPVSL